MAGRRLVLIGAGMTGRGQIAQLAYEDGWALTLVDRDAALVRALRAAGRYVVGLLGEGGHEVVVQGFETLHTDDMPAIAESLRSADLVVTSVLEPNLPDVGRMLATALRPRLRSRVARPLNVVAAENMNHSSTALLEYTRRSLETDLVEPLRQTVGFPDSMVARVVPVADDPLCITAEAFSEWTADRLAVAGEPPALQGLEWVSNQTARLQRKLYIHNTGHAVCGYLGWLAGYRYVHEAALDPGIMGCVAQAIGESGAAVCAEHGFDRDSVRDYERNLQSRLVISALPDDVRRVIRQPIRKLGTEERLLGPLALCEQHGLPSDGLCQGIAAVLCSRMPGDEQFDRMADAVERAGPIAALEELAGYRAGPAAAAAIGDAYARLRSGGEGCARC